MAEQGVFSELVLFLLKSSLAPADKDCNRNFGRETSMDTTAYVICLAGLTAALALLTGRWLFVQRQRAVPIPGKNRAHPPAGGRPR
jgi:hypothetical protein